MTKQNRPFLGVLILAAATVLCWVAWLSWETGYTVDPETEATSGPYSVWQVAGCVVTLAAIAVVAGWRLPPWVVAPVMTLAFTVPWSWHAARSDDSGLWVVGAVLVLIGMAAGSTAVSLVTWLVRRNRTATPTT
ncbi:hypothetical protein GA0070616_2809 [Micromonospora nigra]|uniref:Uncharacterized protein n=1 Tax=Micromonospora nigra TaxID=145857 RepID=A0A1C6S316_9ACTN|nr:hypothetical protein [Micromonospora nigra]SCL23875.1 hypothetical protein GA0070616_2809 [Micromonospora nigra]